MSFNNKLFKLLTFSTICFLIALIISLYFGTNSFNYYCSKVASGDYNGLNFRFGVEQHGFKNCVLNTPTINIFLLGIEIYFCLHLVNAYLVVYLNEKNILKNIFVMVFVYLVFYIFLLISTSLFQSIHWGFLEGGVFIKKGIFINYIFPIHTLKTLTELRFYLLTFIFLQTGPIIMTLLLNTFRLSYGYKPNLSSLLYIFIGSILIQFLTIFLHSHLSRVLFMRNKNLYIKTVKPYPQELLPSSSLSPLKLELK